MHEYTAKKFNLPEVEGISKKQLDAHIKLYEGYVKHTNILQDEYHRIHEGDNPNKKFLLLELSRRYSFEFCGMRLHEYYFETLESGPKEINKDSNLYKAIEQKFGGIEGLEKIIKHVSGTRGSGWVILYWDNKVKNFIPKWVDEHHLGALPVDIVLAVDCWEHAYMIDHDTTGRGAYVEAYLNAVNWSVPEKWFEEVAK